MAISTKRRQGTAPEHMERVSGSETVPGDDSNTGIRFHVMQSLKHSKWVLAAVRGTFESYQVTDVMSANVELMIQYARYLNEGAVSAGMEQRQITMLDQLKQKYDNREAFNLNAE